MVRKCPQGKSSEMLSSRSGAGGKPSGAAGASAGFRAALKASELISERGASPEVLEALTPHLCRAFNACGWGLLLSGDPLPQFKVFIEKKLSEHEMATICYRVMDVYNEYAESGEEAPSPVGVPEPPVDTSPGTTLMLAWQMFVPSGFLGLAFLLGDTASQASLHEVRLFSLLANQLASAIENSRLHAQLQSELAAEAGMDRDPETDLPRRTYFQKELGYEIKRSGRYGQSLSCVLIDFSALRPLGRQVERKPSDVLARHLAAVLRASTREVDVAARLNPGQFGLVLPNTDAAGARVLAKRFIQALEQVRVAPRNGTAAQALPASAGQVRICVGQVRRRGETPYSVLRRLQARLKQAKTGASRLRLLTAPMHG